MYVTPGLRSWVRVTPSSCQFSLPCLAMNQYAGWPPQSNALLWYESTVACRNP